MQDVKKIVLVVVLLAAIVAAVWFTVKRVGGRSGPPVWVQNTVLEKIDRKTLKIIALPRKEWESLQKGPREWKNPETGEVTVTDIMHCRSCGEKIPWPEVPAGVKVFTVLGQYICPKCGKPVGGGQAGGGGQAPAPPPGARSPDSH